MNNKHYSDIAKKIQAIEEHLKNTTDDSSPYVDVIDSKTIKGDTRDFNIVSAEEFLKLSPEELTSTSRSLDYTNFRIAFNMHKDISQIPLSGQNVILSTQLMKAALLDGTPEEIAEFETLIATLLKENLGMDSDWWLAVPGLNAVKLSRDQYKAFRFFQTATPDQMIEGIRDFLGGLKGSLLTIGLDAVGVGEFAEPIIWSLMLAYDCYKYVEKGILNLIDIIADCAAILSAGLGAWIGKAWKGLAKPAKEAGQEVHALIKWVQNNLPSFYRL
jgi:hypothetical protein